MTLVTTVCLIACHAGPAGHFADFARALEARGCQVKIYATGPAVQKFQGFQVAEFSTSDSEAVRIAQECAGAIAVITDVGHLFDVTIQEALATQASGLRRFAYYDNPEESVPGGYSETAEKVKAVAQTVLYANANLAYGDGVGIGYYPVAKAKEIAARRAAEHASMREKFFQKHQLENRGQQILVYAGGNNDVYFKHAFPAFLKILDAAKPNAIVVLQQHPGAKSENKDGKLVEGRGDILISDLSSDDAQVLADRMLYYQTSMGPQFVLAGIPTIQIGHEPYEDILVRNGLCPTAINADQFLHALQQTTTTQSDDVIKQGLGIHPDWADRLVEAIK